jgi:hypothetical protein
MNKGIVEHMDIDDPNAKKTKKSKNPKLPPHIEEKRSRVTLTSVAPINVSFGFSCNNIIKIKICFAMLL